VGATLAGHITRRFGGAGVSRTPVHVHLTGTAGQSLGAFGVPGLDITVHGAANDGVGKGLHGGTLIIRPQSGMPAGAVLIGNAALYGATGGRLFVAGRAGERFAVRNSGAIAVVEGVGHHGCEYMTGGTVVILGAVGPNFGAGMTGGVAFVDDKTGVLGAQLNSELVCAEVLTDDEGAELRALVSEHYNRTGSARAFTLLAQWSAWSRTFRTVKPHDQTTTADRAGAPVAVAHHRARAATAADRSRA
jgi:glutamate synthase domain-containing protein 3